MHCMTEIVTADGSLHGYQSSTYPDAVVFLKCSELGKRNNIVGAKMFSCDFSKKFPFKNWFSKPKMGDLIRLTLEVNRFYINKNKKKILD